MKADLLSPDHIQAIFDNKNGTFTVIYNDGREKIRKTVPAEQGKLLSSFLAKRDQDIEKFERSNGISKR